LKPVWKAILLLCREKRLKRKGSLGDAPRIRV
jgi:hypothetical protein